MEIIYNKIDSETLEVVRKRNISKQDLLNRKQELEAELLNINAQLDILR